MWKSIMTAATNVDARIAQYDARARLQAVRRQVPLGADISEEEQADADILANRLHTYFTEVRVLSDVSIDARLAGCGPILGGSADLIGVDLSYGVHAHIIAEIKSVNRKFRSTDVRQLVTYLVLYFAMYGEISDIMIVMNPLLGRSLEVEVDKFFEFATGRPSQEVIPELLFDWSTAGTSL